MSSFTAKMHNMIRGTKRSVLWFFASCMIAIVASTTLAHAAFNKQLNYQGKLTNASNVAVADGTYNMEFKLYTVSSGGVAIWTETRTGTDKVQVTNGLFSVLLGEVNPLTGVNFNQTLYLGVNIGGTGTPSWDGEMTPRKKLGAVPAAVEAENLGGASASQYLRSDIAATSSVTDNTNAAFTIAQLGTGNIFDVFDGATKVLTVLDGGNVGIGDTTPLALFTVGNGDKFQVDGSGNATLQDQGELRLGDADGSNYIGLKAPATIASNFTWTLPSSDSAGCLQSDGSGNISISSCGGSGSSALSSITAATGTNTINNGNFAQEWEWNGLGAATGFKISSSSTAAASNLQKLFEVGLSGANATASQTTYGIYAANTHTGTGATNVAGYFSASGGATNYAIQIGSGALRIGDTSIINNGTNSISIGGAIPAVSGSFFAGPLSGNNADYANNSVFIGNGAGDGAAYGSESVYIGHGAGAGVTYNTYNTFIGKDAGSSAYGDNQLALGIGAGTGSGANSGVAIGQNAGTYSNGDNANIIGNSAGYSAGVVTDSNFLGTHAGDNSGAAAKSNFIGYYAGSGATGSAYSNLIGYQAGKTFTGNTIGSNNIIIGTNVTVPDGVSDAINIGGVLFGSGTNNIAYSPYDPISTPVSTGMIGIGNSNPLYRLDVLNANTDQVDENRVFNVSNAGSTFDTSTGIGTSYAGFFSSTSTRSAGTDPLTNIGLYAAASGGQNNYAAIFGQGNVGIGDVTPSALLSVGAGDLFQVNSSGAIAAATGITTTGNVTLSTVPTTSAGTYDLLTRNTSTGVIEKVASSTFLTGNQTITLSGDVSGSGTTAITTTIGANAVTYAKFQQVAASSIVGNPTGSLANATDIGLGAGLAFSAGTLVTSNIPNASLQNSSLSFATGTTGTDVNWSSSPVALGGTATLNIPDAGASARGLVTTGTQTFAGAKTFSSTTGITLSNADTIDNATNSTFTFGRNDAGTVTLTAKDNDATAALSLVQGGAAALSIGNSSTTAITLTTDGTGDAEVALPTGSVSGTEILDNTIGWADIANATSLDASTSITMGAFTWDMTAGSGSQSSNPYTYWHLDNNSSYLRADSDTFSNQRVQLRAANSDGIYLESGDTSGAMTYSFGATTSGLKLTTTTTTGPSFFLGIDALGLVTKRTAAQTLSDIGALSSSTTATQNGYFGNIALQDDTSPSHYLTITDAEDLTANHTLSVSVNNADRTVSLSGNLTVSSAATVSGTNTGDVTLAGQNYLSLAGQVITANAVDLSGTNVTGTLAASRLGAFTGDVTSVGGTYATTIASNAVTYAKFQQVAANSIVGNPTGALANAQGITLGTGLAFSGTSLITSNIPNSSLQNSTIALVLGTSGSDANVTGSPASLGGTITLNIPDASTTARGLVTTGTQTFAGNKTVNGNFSVVSNAAEPASALTVNTSGAWTNGSSRLASFKNNGTEVMGITHSGAILVGTNVLTSWGDPMGETLVSMRDTSAGDASLNEIALGVSDKAGGTYFNAASSYGYFDTWGYAGDWRTWQQANSGGNNTVYDLRTLPTDISMSLQVNGNTKVRLNPTMADGASAIPFYFNTATNLATAGAKIVSFQNSGSEKFSVDKDGVGSFAGAIKSAALTSGRVTFATTGGQLTDSSALSWNNSTNILSVNAGAGGAGEFIYTGSSATTGLQIQSADINTNAFLRMDDVASGGYMSFGGAASVDFLPTVTFKPGTTYPYGLMLVQSSDTGSQAAFTIDSRLASGALTTQPIFGVQSYGGTPALQVNADSTTWFNAAVLPRTSDGAALGSTSKMWSDLFLASGGVINWNNGDVTLTHSTDALTLAGGNLTISNLATGGTAPTTTGTTRMVITDGNGQLSFASAPVPTGTNTGDVTLTAVGSSPNANGASLSGQALTLQPADGSNPGVLTAGTQTIGGAKTFASPIAQSPGAAANLSNYLLTNQANAANTTTLNPGILVYNDGHPWGMDLGYNNSRYRTRIFASDIGDVALSYVTGTNPTGQSNFTDALVVRGDSGGAGFVGINVLSPSSRLDVANDVTGLAVNTKVVKFSNGSSTFNTTAGALTSYTGYFTSTSTRSAGTNALTNVGLYASASGAQNNYAAIFDQGYVGIGTTTPSDLLTVNTGASNRVVMGDIAAAGSGGTLVVGNGGMTYASTAYASLFDVTDSGTVTIGDSAVDLNGTLVQVSDMLGNISLNATNGFLFTGGNISVSALDTDNTAPTTTGTTKMVITDANGQLSFTNIPAGGSTTLNSIIAATGTNTINNAAYAQEWQWNSLTTGTGMKLSSTSVSSGALLDLTVNSTAAASDSQKALNISTSGTNSTTGMTTYGAYVSNSHAGTSSTNVAMYLSATGGTANRALIIPSGGGRVGIGTTSPTYLMDVVESSTGFAPAINIANSDTSTASYAQIAFAGSGRTFGVGVGNSTETVNSLANKFFIYDSTSNAVRFVVDTGGSVGIGDATPNSLFTVGFNDAFQINSSGQVTNGSITSTFGAIDVGADNITTTGTVFGNTIDRSTVGALLIGSTASSTSICNSTACDTIQLGTNADADTITIGDTSNLDAITVNGTLTNTNGSGSNSVVNLSSTGDFIIQDNGAAFATFNDSGNVGIGTAPTYKFDVLNATTAQTATNRVANFSNAGATFNTTAGALSSYTGYFSSTSTRSTGSNALTNVGLYATASGAQNNYAAIFDQGNVGIGTTTPTDKFQIYSSTNTADLLKVQESGAINTNANTYGVTIMGKNTYLSANYPILAVGDTSQATAFGIALEAKNGVYNIPTIQLGFSGSGGALDMWNYRSWQPDGTYGMKFTTKASGNAATDRISIGGNADTVDVLFKNSNVGIGATAASSKLDITTNSLGTTQTTSSGLALVNTTAAGSGAQQISPAIRWTGQGWKTDATAASQAVDFRSYLVPVQGTANPSGYLTFESAVNGGSFSNIFTVDSSGKIGVGGITAPTNTLSVNGTGYVSGWFGISTTSQYNSSDFTIGDATDTDLWMAFRGKKADNSEIRLVMGTQGNVGVGNDNAFIGTATGDKLEFRTNNSGRLTILGGGNVGIANGNPSYALHVGTSSISGIVARFENSTGTCDINPTTTSLSCSSDMRLKKNITTLDSADESFVLNTDLNTQEDTILAKVLALTPVTYNWNSEDDSDPKHVGFIAQEVEQVFPDLVSTDDQGRKSLNYIGLVPYTIKAVQEMNIRVAALPEFEDQTMAQKVADFLQGIAERGEAVISSIKAQRVHTEELCVGSEGDEVCVTKEQLQNLLNNTSASAGGTPTPTEPTPTPDQGTDTGTTGDTAGDTTTTDTGTSGTGTTDTSTDTTSADTTTTNTTSTPPADTGSTSDTPSI